jgi:molybdopterin-guanine dinucleotide biosynthesis protein A
LENSTLAASVAAAVKQAAGTATLVGSNPAHARLGYPFLPDVWPGQGPLGAIVSILGCTAAESNLIVACDMPGLAPAFLQRLMDAIEQAENRPEVVVAAGPSGQIEPLCAVWRRSAGPAVERAFRAGERGVMALLAGKTLRVNPLKTSEAVYFQNLNTPEDWAAYDR